MKEPYKHTNLNEKFSDFEFSVEDSSWESIAAILPSRGSASLNDKFKDFSLAPSNAVWNNLENKLHPNRKKRKAWLFFSSIAASIIILFGVYYMEKPDGIQSKQLVIGNRASSTNERKSSISKRQVVIDDNLVFKHEKQVVVENRRARDNNKKTTTNRERLAGHNKTWKSGEKNKKKSTSKEHLANNHEQPKIRTWQLGEKNKKNSTSLKAITNKRESSESLNYLITRQYNTIKNIENRPEIEGKALPWINDPNSSNLYTINSLALSSSFSDKYVQSSSSYSSHEEFVSADGLSIINNLTSNEEKKSQVEYETPKSFNLFFNRKITTRSSIESGIGILLLRSKFNISNTTNFNEIKNEISYKRDYLCIPLNYQLRIINRRKVNLYSTLGTAFEFSIQEKKTTLISYNSSLISDETTKVKMGIGQMNINFGVGSQVRIYKNFHIYLEGNVAHYIYQSKPNYWSNQKFIPMVKTGLKYDF